MVITRQLGHTDPRDEDDVPLSKRRSLQKQHVDEEEHDAELKLKKNQEQEEVEKEKSNSEEKIDEEEEMEVSDSKEESDGEENKESEEEVKAKPIGEVVRVFGKGTSKQTHYRTFELNGKQYDLEDSVLFIPEHKNQKPYIGIIKDISEKNRSVVVEAQWLYRPDEAAIKGGVFWKPCDNRELFYSFHCDAQPAEAVKHKCVLHFVPLDRQLPSRKEHPGFIVQRLYDHEKKKLYKLTDKDFQDKLQQEIDLLLEKTRSRLGELPVIKPEETTVELELSKIELVKKRISPLDVSKEHDVHQKTGTPPSCTDKAIILEHYTMLKKFNALTGDTNCDKCLAKLLGAIQVVFSSVNDDKEEGEFSEMVYEPKKNSLKGTGSLIWPDGVIPAVSALELAMHDALSAGSAKYTQKLRQLVFNLGLNNATLTRRLLNGELEPSKIVCMSPIELKNGLTVEESLVEEPAEPQHLQMTNASCKGGCEEKRVCLLDIIQAGKEDRCKLECLACGNSWYASREEAAMLTVYSSPEKAESAQKIQDRR